MKKITYLLMIVLFAACSSPVPQVSDMASGFENPENERFTSTNIQTHGYRTQPNYWLVEPAGLLGPVRLVQSINVMVDMP